MATLAPFPDLPPAPAESSLCPCGLPWAVFVIENGKGGRVSRRCCFTCGAGVPPHLWKEHRIADLFAGVELSGWIITATFSQVSRN